MNVQYGTIVPAADDTAGLQALINAQTGKGEIIIPAGTWNVGGLTIPAGGMAIRGEWPGGTILHLTANAPAFYGSDISAPIAIRDLVFTGDSPNWDGSTINISDAGQSAVHLIDCTDFRIENCEGRNLSGSAFDFEAPNSSFASTAKAILNGLAAFGCYRGVHTRNSFEFGVFNGFVARGNIFGVMLESGNITFTDFALVYNYNNIQILGRANNNPGHATFSGGKSDHSFYVLDIDGDQLGSSFTNVDFLGDPGGSLTNNGGMNMRIADSRSVNIVGGQFGANLVVSQSDPSGGDTTKSGVNILQGVTVRDDIPGFVAPVCDAGATLLCKGNVSVTSGALATWNN